MTLVGCSTTNRRFRMHDMNGYGIAPYVQMDMSNQAYVYRIALSPQRPDDETEPFLYYNPKFRIVW